MGSVISKLLEEERECRPLISIDEIGNKESVIKWKTGVPTKDGKYLVTLDDDSIACVDFNLDCDGDEEFFNICVLAWCKMDEIKPYKKSKPS